MWKQECTSVTRVTFDEPNDTSNVHKWRFIFIIRLSGMRKKKGKTGERKIKCHLFLVQSEWAHLSSFRRKINHSSLQCYLSLLQLLLPLLCASCFVLLREKRGRCTGKRKCSEESSTESLVHKSALDMVVTLTIFAWERGCMETHTQKYNNCPWQPVSKGTEEKFILSLHTIHSLPLSLSPSFSLLSWSLPSHGVSFRMVY